MLTSTTETLRVRSSDDMVRLRQWVRARAADLGLTLVDQTKLITAASELARNILDHGGGDGTVSMDVVDSGARRGLRLVFEDKGPGIANIEQAMRDGFTTASGLGLGLGGSKRLVNEFDIASRPGEGTRVTIIRWR